jgi:hypothetical protein
MKNIFNNTNNITNVSLANSALQEKFDWLAQVIHSYSKLAATEGGLV